MTGRQDPKTVGETGNGLDMYMAGVGCPVTRPYCSPQLPVMQTSPTKMQTIDLLVRAPSHHFLPLMQAGQQTSILLL